MSDRDIEHISYSFTRFIQKLTKEYYLFESGLNKELNLIKIYSEYTNLIQDDTILEIKSKIIENKQDIAYVSKMKYLLEGLCTEVFGNKVKSLREKLSVLESAGIIELNNGEKMKYISSVNYLYNTELRDKREEIRKARNSFIDEKLNPLYIEEFVAEREYIKSLGYNDKVNMFYEISGIDLVKLNEELKVLLAGTEKIYDSLLSKFAENKLNLSSDKLYRHDIYYMMRGGDFENIFLYDKVYDTAHALCCNMGIDMNAGGKIIIDTESRDSKSPRAFCATVSVPEEIYLVINPQGNVNDLSAFLHELGHALHFAHVSYDLDIVYKYLGDDSVSEGYAMLFDHLLLDKNWLKYFTKKNSEELNEYIEYSILKELLMLRRFAAKLEYEIQLNKETDVNTCKHLYSSILKNATKIIYDEEEFLSDVDPNFYCARYLRAWMFCYELNNFMINNFGDNWFLKKSSGGFLKKMWAYGNRFNAEELMQINNLGELSAKTLLDNIERMLNKS